MAKILFAILLLFIKLNNSYETNDNIENETDYSIKPGKSETFRISYLRNTSFNFTKFITDSPLLINIHSINCKIDVTSEGGDTIFNSNLEIYSIRVNSSDTKIYVKPFKIQSMVYLEKTTKKKVAL